MSKDKVTIRLQDYDNHIGVKALDLSNTIDHIPARVYKVTHNPETGEIILIKDREKFDTVTKVYGNIKNHERTIIDDFKTTDKSLGVILSGWKGSGKSLLAERISNYYIKQGLPVFYVVDSVPHQLLKAVIKIAQPCVVFFDEFEKNYQCVRDDELNREVGEQVGMLSFFSDSDYKKVLFLITSNNSEHLSTFMINRPSRFKYHIRHSEPSEQGIQEIVKEFKLNVWQTKAIRRFSIQYGYDGLIQICKILKNSATIEDFNETISIYNIGTQIHIHISLSGLGPERLMFNGVPFTGGITGKLQSDGNTTDIYFHDQTNSLVHTETVLLDSLVTKFLEEPQYEILLSVGEGTLKLVSHFTERDSPIFIVNNAHVKTVVNGYESTTDQFLKVVKGDALEAEETVVGIKSLLDRKDSTNGLGFPMRVNYGNPLDFADIKRGSLEN